MSQSRDKMKAVTLEELEDDWQGEDFCIRVLCEDEQGWHVVGEPLSLINRTSEEIYKALKDAAPFLARIYAVLKQSAINLNCLSSKKGDNFLNYIRKEGIDTKNFSDAYKVIHKLVSESEDRDQFISPLNRCYLQSGKISWLCPDHQNKAGITQLQIGTASIHGTSRVLIFEEDKLLKDLSVAYRFLSLEKQGGKDGQSVQKEKSFVIKNSGLKKEKSDVEKKGEEKNTKKSEERNEERQTPRKKKSDKTVKIADTSISIPSPSTSRPVSSTSSTATSSKSGTSTLSRRKSQRKTTSQACSIQ
ncbi:Hypothetical predicted protein [Mytilus galloprovincialis]|nr:Hypothetical predicted protein [Mytilus galloprovincialis]